MANDKHWKYKTDDNGNIVEATFTTTLVVQSLMMDGARLKTLDGKNAYLQIINEFRDITHKAKFPPLIKQGSKIEIIIKLKTEG